MSHLTSTTHAVTNTAFEVRFSGVGRSFQPEQTRRGETAPPQTVLRNINLTITPGELIAVLGASGCGKSTLLRITAGLDSGYSGSVSIDGSEVAGIDSRCAFSFQEPRLLPWRTVERNVALGLPTEIDQKSGTERVHELLELVGLTASAQLRPREISGGMAQRVALARALARNPGVLLLDEPFGALDALTRLKMQDLLLDVHEAAPTTVLLVTHDVDEALQLADRVMLLGRMPGEPGATVAELVTVPGARPRDRGSAELAELRAHLLEGLGVDRHLPGNHRKPGGL